MQCLERHVDGHLHALPEQTDGNRVPHVPRLEDGHHGQPLAQEHGAPVVGQLDAVNLEEHVPGDERPLRAAPVFHVRYHHPGVGVLHLEVLPQRRGLQQLQVHPEGGQVGRRLLLGVVVVVDAPQEPVYDRRRDHVTLILHRAPGVPLERDAHQPARALAQHGPAAVPRVDGGVHRHRQGPRVRVRVGLNLHSGHHALGDAQVVPTNREPEHVHLLPQLGQTHRLPLRQRHGVHAVQALVDGDEREVNFVQHRHHARGDLLRGVGELDLDVGGVGDDVRGGEDEAAAVGVAPDHRTGSRAPLRGLGLPRINPVRLQEGDQELDHSLVLVEVEGEVVVIEALAQRDLGLVVRSLLGDDRASQGRAFSAERLEDSVARLRIPSAGSDAAKRDGAGARADRARTHHLEPLRRNERSARVLARMAVHRL